MAADGESSPDAVPVMQAPMLSYSPPPGKGARVWAGVALLMAGLGLILLGGCFMIGIMAINAPGGGFGGAAAAPVVKTSGQEWLEILLYVISFACFGGAVYLFGVGLNWLRRIVFS
jgi:hypothetical protein